MIKQEKLYPPPGNSEFQRIMIPPKNSAMGKRKIVVCTHTQGQLFLFVWYFLGARIHDPQSIDTRVLSM